jgi:hypothetical protein
VLTLIYTSSPTTSSCYMCNVKTQINVYSNYHFACAKDVASLDGCQVSSFVFFPPLLSRSTPLPCGLSSTFPLFSLTPHPTHYLPAAPTTLPPLLGHATTRHRTHLYSLTSSMFDGDKSPNNPVVIPGFNIKPNTYIMCVQESSLHTYRVENRYIITNATNI